MKLRSLPLSLFAAAGLVALLSACSEPSHPDPRTETPRVSVTRVQPDRAPAQAYTGVVSARVQSELGFRVAGKVTERLVDVGQAVKRGQLLMRLDRSDLGLALDAQAFTVSALRARAEQTRADEARLRGLVEQGAISAQAYDQAKAGADSAQALLDSAVAQQKVAGNAADYALLTADVDGVVVDTLAEPGQVVRAGEPVVRLARAGQREALVNLPESVRPAIGSRAQAALHSHPGVLFPARLRQLSDAADARSRTYEARYVLEGDAARAPLGATVTLHLNDAAGEANEARVSVPIAALHDAGQGTGVWVLDEQGNAVHFRPVTVARLGDETASISAGLKVGERIVAMGAHLLQEGRAVRVTDLPGGRP